MAKENEFLNEDSSLPQIFNEIVSVKDLIKNSEGMVAIDFNLAKDRLQGLVAKFSGVIPTEENLKEAREARSLLRQPRYDMDKIEKHNNSIIDQRMKSLKKINKDQMEELRAIVGPEEKRFDETIKAAEAKAEEKRIAKEEAEKERVHNINSIINDWKDLLVKTESDIRLGKDKVQTLENQLQEFKNGFDQLEEYKYIGENVVDGYVDKFEELLKIEKEFEANEEKLRIQKEEEQKQKELIEKKVTVFIQTLISKGAKELDSDTYDLEGTRFSRSIMGITEVEQFNLAVKQAEDSAKQRKEDEQRRAELKAEEEKLAARREAQRIEDEKRAARIRKEDEDRQNAIAEQNRIEEEKRKKEAEEKRLADEEQERLFQERKQLVAVWNEHAEQAKSLFPNETIDRRTLENVPTEQEVNQLMFRMSERIKEIRNLERSEIVKLGTEAKTKIVTAFVDQMQVPRTGNQYVNEQLDLFEAKVKDAIAELSHALFITKN